MGLASRVSECFPWELAEPPPRVSAPVSAWWRTGTASGSTSQIEPRTVRLRAADIAANPPSAIPARFGGGMCWGSRGQSPPPAPLYPQGVGWLVTLSTRQASLGTAPKTPLRAPPRPASRSQAPRPRGRQPHERRGAPGRRPRFGGRRRSLPRTDSPPPIPHGDRRSSIIRDPVARRSPEMPPWSPGNGFRTPRGLDDPAMRP